MLRSRAGMLVVVPLILAGCAAPASETSPTTAVKEHAILRDVSSSGCTALALVMSMPLSAAQAHLPAGWHAAEILVQGVGHAVLQLVACHQGFAWGSADLGIVVVPPALDIDDLDAANRTERAGHVPVDVYLVASHTDHPELQELLSLAGVPHAAGRFTNSPAGPGSVYDDAGVLVEFVAAPVPLGSHTTHLRSWSAGEEGVMLIERLMTAPDGSAFAFAQGAAACRVEERSLFAEVAATHGCDIAEAVLGPLEMPGRAYWFHDDILNRTDLTRSRSR